MSERKQPEWEEHPYTKTVICPQCGRVGCKTTFRYVANYDITYVTFPWREAPTDA